MGISLAGLLALGYSSARKSSVQTSSMPRLTAAVAVCRVGKGMELYLGISLAGLLAVGYSSARKDSVQTSSMPRLIDAPELGSKVRRIVEKEPVWVNTTVVWEMLIKKGIGKLKISGNVDRQLQDEGFNILDIKLDHVMALETQENHHADPFDRIQVAQAKTERFTFITKDKAIQKYSGLDILAV